MNGKQIKVQFLSSENKINVNQILTLALTRESAAIVHLHPIPLVSTDIYP